MFSYLTLFWWVFCSCLHSLNVYKWSRKEAPSYEGQLLWQCDKNNGPCAKYAWVKTKRLWERDWLGTRMTSNSFSEQCCHCIPKSGNENFAQGSLQLSAEIAWNVKNISLDVRLSMLALWKKIYFKLNVKCRVVPTNFKAGFAVEVLLNLFGGFIDLLFSSNSNVQ